MSLLRLLSISAFASICAGQAAAQSPAAPNPAPPATTFTSPRYTFPQAYTFPTPRLSTPSPVVQYAPPAPVSPFSIPKVSPAPAPSVKILSATSDSCFTIRSYGFTAGDLHSSSPRPSTASTCTPARMVTLKDGTATSAK